MAISHNNCAPFLSATLVSIQKPPVSAAQLREVMLERLKNAAGGGVTRRVYQVEAPTFSEGSADVGWIHYSETRSPGWYIASDLVETHHHSIFIVKKGALVAFVFSDPALRNTIISDLRKRRVKLFERVKLLTAQQINDGFVRSARVRTLWLSGAHRRTSTKADSKILTGRELETALDPLEDQSYYFSSVRSTHDSLTFDAVRAGVVVGASPRHARVWIGPSKDWITFIKRIEGLIDAAAKAIKSPSTVTSPLPVLASPIDGIAGAKEPYDMAISVSEAVSAGIEDNRDPWFHEFSDAARFEITPKAGSPSFIAEVYWGKESYGRIKYEFESAADGSVDVKVSQLSWSDGLDYSAGVRRICFDTDFLTVYFDTGHTFAQGHFYATRFRDPRFVNWQWAKLDGVAIDTEKPLEGKKLKVADIGAPSDTSLFGFVAKHWPNLLDGRAATGWLICDDGSMESADFIHFDDQARRPRLSLIHVKGSGSAAANRGISVSDYEIVVGQAIKNLRYLDRTNIADKLGLEENKQIGTAVWRNGARQKNRKDVVHVLKQAGSNIDKAVYVFQPRVKKSAEEKIGAQIKGGHFDRADVRRLQQLDTLLLAARAECFGLGAEFHVIGEDDVGQAPVGRRK